MKACGRTLPSGDKCGDLFEGSGSYCRTCRNEYMREYHKKQKTNPLDAPRAELPGVSCECCSEALRNNTIKIVEVENVSVRLCSRCSAVLKYLTTEINAQQAEYMIDMVLTVNGVEEQPGTSSVQPYVPQLTMPPTSVAVVEKDICLNCEVAPARPGSAFCAACGV